jgi:ribosomal-protein-alanine N-acetyltransferase
VASSLESKIPAIAKLEKICFSEPWTEGMISGSVFSGNYIFSFVYPGGSESDEPAGYACGLIAPEQCEIQRICVLPEFRRLGYGERLMNELKNVFAASGASSVFLEVRASNIPARNLYEKLGYKQLGIRKNYYSDDDAAIYMLEL